MGEARPLGKVDRLHNTDWHARCVELKLELRETRRLLAASERNTSRFHALLLQERIRKIGAAR